jgi:hypothetical protein
MFTETHFTSTAGQVLISRAQQEFVSGGRRSAGCHGLSSEQNPISRGKFMRLTYTKLSIAIVTAVAFLSSAMAVTLAGQPVAEKTLIQLIELNIDDAAIIAKIQADGVGFSAENAIIERLENAGARPKVIDAVRQAQTAAQSSTSRQSQNDPPISYEAVRQLVALGIDEQAILKRLSASPTLFVLDARQEAQLRAIGASDLIIAALKGQRSSAPTTGDITNIAVILDCSGSMKEHTTDGQPKMEVARKVVAQLIQNIPNGLRLTFVVYGHDASKKCNAVQIVRPLSDLDDQGKTSLTGLIGGLRPAGATPIALALRTAGRELAKSDAQCGLILISDGKETCNGDPAAEAAELAQRLQLSFGAHVIGFDVDAEGRASLESIATAGGGEYYHAANAAELNDAIQSLKQEIDQAVAVAPEQREDRDLALDAERAAPGAFFHDAPTVSANEYQGTLAMKQAHYYRVQLKAGQEIRAIGIVQKQAYEASNKRVNQTFSVAIFDGGLQLVERSEKVVKGNPSSPATFRATWTAPTNTVAYVAVAASDNHNGDGIHVSLYGDEPDPAPYKLRIRLSETESTGPAPAATALSSARSGRGFADAGRIAAPSLATTDIKLGEVAFFRVDVTEGETLRIAAAAQKPWYRVGNWYTVKKNEASYTIAVYDDDQFKVAEETFQVIGNPSDARSHTLAWKVELSGAAWISISCDNTGHKTYSPNSDIGPGRLSIQVTK